MSELSGEKITLVSKSGGKFELAREIAQQSQLIRNIISTADKEDSEGGSGSGGSDEAGSGNTEVPVRVVEDDILAKVIQFMTHHHDNPMADIEKPIPTDNMDDIATDPFDRAFVDVGQETLFNLISAANFLDIPALLDLTCAKVATMLKGKTPEQVKESFNIEGEFTPEEEAKVNAENPWLEEL